MIWERLGLLWKLYLILGCAIILLIGAYFISATRFGTICNPDIMAEHYDEIKSGLHDLIDYTSQSLDKGAQMQLEFKHGKISMFHVIGENDSIWSYNWDIHSEDRIDSLMQVVGLNHENSRISNES